MSVHWIEPWLAEPYLPGEAECWHFARRVWRVQFGFDIAADLPASATGREAIRAIEAEAAGGGWREVTDPEEGDAVLMSRGRRPCHVGIFVAPAHVLHAIDGAGAICTPVPRLGALGYSLHSVHRRAT